MNSQNDKDSSPHIRAAVIAGIFGVIAACISVTGLIIIAFINNGFIFAGAGNSNPPNIQPTLENVPQVQPTTILQVESNPVICYGQCWEFDDNARTMTWTGFTDGTEDIWQPSGEPLQNIRSGYAAIITTSVPGEIFACILSVDGKSVKNSCDGVLYQIPAGTYRITSTSNDVGGFRWCPLVGYGYKANGGGGACK